MIYLCPLPTVNRQEGGPSVSRREDLPSCQVVRPLRTRRARRQDSHIYRKRLREATGLVPVEQGFNYTHSA